MTTISQQPVVTERAVAVPTWDSRLRASWGAIMLGALSAVGLQFILTALGVALGMSLLSTDASAEGISMAGGVWWLITGLISLFVGGMVLGLSMPAAPRVQTCIGSAAMWAIVALFGFVVLWSGVGMGATAAATPLAVVTSQQMSGGMNTAFNRNLNYNPDAGNASAIDGMAVRNNQDQVRTPQTAAEVERVESALQAASWWTVVGLVAGLAATWGGAVVARRPIVP